MLLQAEEGVVMVSYSVPDFLQKPNATVSIVACFSTFSQYDRAWRKGNPLNLAVSHPFPPHSYCIDYIAAQHPALTAHEVQ